MDLITDEAPSAPALRYGLRFEGSGAEYFKIWIVNLALSVVTLGVFSAWAKVRSMRYFYGNTYIGDHSFDYHADPLRILIGRIIAVAALLAYSLANAFAPVIAVILAIALMIATPWLIVASLRFKARNTSYRNIRFNFTGTYGDAFGAYFLWPLLVGITLGTTYPLARRAQLRFNINNHTFGGKPFQSDFPGKVIYGAYFKGLLIGALLMIPVVGIGYFFAEGGQGEPANIPGTILTGTLMAVAGLFLITFVGTLVFNLAMNNTVLSDRYKLESRLSPTWMVWLALSNLALILVTLGLFYPWARVRTAQYTASQFAVTGPADLDGFTAELVSGQGAIGEEVASFFDVDVGL